jgi:hypothetical protein
MAAIIDITPKRRTLTRARLPAICRLIAFLAKGPVPPIGTAVLAIIAAWTLFLAGFAAAVTP